MQNQIWNEYEDGYEDDISKDFKPSEIKKKQKKII